MSNKYIFTAKVEIYAVSKDDAQIGIICAMDDHDIDWGIEVEQEADNG